jgi:hypothetical protein
MSEHEARILAIKELAEFLGIREDQVIPCEPKYPLGVSKQQYDECRYWRERWANRMAMEPVLTDYANQVSRNLSHNNLGYD